MKLKIPLECTEQKALFEWAATQPSIRDYLIAIPNGGSRHPVEAHNLKLQGVRAGVPDIFFAVPREKFHGLWIELKRTKGGMLSDQQIFYLDLLQNQGYRTAVCRGWVEAKDCILNYLGKFTNPNPFLW